MTMLDSIRHVLSRNHVTFAELTNEIEGFKGDLEWCIGDHNVVIWAGMSREAVDALEVIRAEGEYELASTSPLTYLIDGMTLNLPIAKSSRRYKNPHWAPAILRKRQPKPAQKRRRRA